MSLPARPANLKAHAERIVRAIEEDRLEQMIRVPRGLKRAVDQFCVHYHPKGTTKTWKTCSLSRSSLREATGRAVLSRASDASVVGELHQSYTGETASLCLQ